MKEDGSSVTVFESAACLLYMASEFDTEGKISYPYGTPEYWSQVSWVSTTCPRLDELGTHPGQPRLNIPSRTFSSRGRLRAMVPCRYHTNSNPLGLVDGMLMRFLHRMGQATHFLRYASEDVRYGIWRYTAECRRLHDVLNKQLVCGTQEQETGTRNATLEPTKLEYQLTSSNLGQSSSPFLAGDRLTIADIATFTYAHSAKWCGIDIAEYPHVKAWRDRLAQRSGFRKGLLVPGPYPFGDEAVVDPASQKYIRLVRKVGAQIVKRATDQWDGEAVALPSDHANLPERTKLGRL